MIERFRCGFPLPLAALAGWLAGAAAAAQPAPPPSVLLILADDLGIEHLQAYGIGAQFPPTPNLDALAGRGLLLRDVWSNPLCSPTRATIQTGRYAFRTGIGSNVEDDETMGLPLAELIVPEVLRQHAPVPYATAAFGKWHLGEDASLGGTFAPNQAGYEHFDGFLKGQQPGGVFDYFNYVKTIDGVNFPSDGTYQTTDLVDSAIAWINGAPRPWFAYVAFFAPHAPYHWPPPELHSQDMSQEGDLPKYRAMIEAMDRELGRLLAAADTTNTLIVFASDNGSPPQVAQPPVAPQRAKGTVFQGGVRVPMILAGDMVPHGEVAAIANLADLFATIAEIAGATVPADVVVDGVSLTPYFSSPGGPPLRATAYTDLFSPNGFGPYATGEQAAREERYKYLRDTAGAEALIDLWVDPWETQNLLLAELTEEQQAAYDELVDTIDALLGICSRGKQGDPCSRDEDCCSGRCVGRRSRVCRDLKF